VSWLVTSLVAGWFVVYNVMRVTGEDPRSAAGDSLAIGIALGVAAFAIGFFVWRRLAATGLVGLHGDRDLPAVDALDPGQRSALRLTAPLLGALAVIALVVGAVILGDWLGDADTGRSNTKLILALWDLLVALWFGDEALRLRRLEVDGLDSMGLGAALTAVLAGVALSRGTFEAGQVVLIVTSGVAGAVASLALWRLAGRRGVPLTAIGVALAAVLSLVLPLA
jgi:hypothetical protein